MAPVIAIYLLWLVWFLAWIGASRWLSPPTKWSRFVKGIWYEILYRTLVVLGALMLFGFSPVPRYDMIYRFWPTLTGFMGWLMFVLSLTGFGFAWWARIHLGRLWLGRAHRHDANIIETGPYAFARHPVYSGIIVATFATAVMFGTPWTLVGAIVMAAGLVLKAWLEERILRGELGEATYDAYAKRVPMLVPFMRWPG